MQYVAVLILIGLLVYGVSLNRQMRQFSRYLENQAYDKAQALAYRMLRYAPFAYMQFIVSLAHIVQHHYEVALPYLERALKRHPRLMVAYLNKSYVLIRLGRLDEANSTVTQALQHFPDMPVLLRQQTSIALAMNNLEVAEAAINRALEVARDDVNRTEQFGAYLPGHYKNLDGYRAQAAMLTGIKGQVLAHQGRPDVALALVNEAIATHIPGVWLQDAYGVQFMQEKTVSLYVIRGMIHYELGDIVSARADFETAHADCDVINLDLVELGLAAIYNAIGSPQQADALLERVKSRIDGQVSVEALGAQMGFTPELKRSWYAMTKPMLA
ncbi:MAG: tetratricopeptide repeat protein [Chloroflexota bacterium]